MKTVNTDCNNIVFLSNNSKFDIDKSQYFIDDKIVDFPKSEYDLLQLLCKNKNISVYEIFLHVWDDLEKEFSSVSVRTLVKKLRKKLPDEILKYLWWFL